MPISVSKKWIYFFAILQTCGLGFATLQTLYIIFEIRKNRKILEGD